MHKGAGEDDTQTGGGETEGDELTEVQPDLVEEAVVAVVLDDVVEEGHFEGSFATVVAKGRVEEGFLLFRIGPGRGGFELGVLNLDLGGGSSP